MAINGMFYNSGEVSEFFESLIVFCFSGSTKASNTLNYSSLTATPSVFCSNRIQFLVVVESTERLHIWVGFFEKNLYKKESVNSRLQLYA